MQREKSTIHTQHLHLLTSQQKLYLNKIRNDVRMWHNLRSPQINWITFDICAMCIQQQNKIYKQNKVYSRKKKAKKWKTNENLCLCAQTLSISFQQKKKKKLWKKRIILTEYVTEKSLCGEEKFYAIQQDAFQWKYYFVYMRHVCFGYISRAITENCLPFKTELATVLPLRLRDFFLSFIYSAVFFTLASEWLSIGKWILSIRNVLHLCLMRLSLRRKFSNWIYELCEIYLPSSYTINIHFAQAIKRDICLCFRDRRNWLRLTYISNRSHPLLIFFFTFI